MNKVKNIQKEKFYISDISKCSYYPEKEERKLFTFLNDFNDSKIYESLISNGFRRSQNVLYNQICDGCNKCIPIRINTRNFINSKNHKRIKKKCINFERIISGKITYEQFYLFKRYLSFKHPESEMNDMIFSDYYSMIKNSGIDTKLIEYRFDEKLVACCITDFLEESLSMVYSFYSPKYLKFSLGKFMILDHICLSKDMYKELLYLGYWIHGFKDMNYKSDFNSTEILINNNWIKYEKENSYF